MIDSMVFYKSFYDGIKILPQKEQNALFNTIFEYSFYGNEQKLDGTAKGMWMLIKPQIDANLRRRENGSKGGRPKTNGFETEKPMVSEKETKTETDGDESEKPNVNVNVNANENVNVNTKKRFVPPTREEVKEYVRENNLQVDADNFFDYFNDTNWIDSKGNKVNSWKGKLRTWAKFSTPKKKEQPFIESNMNDDLSIIESLSGRRCV